MQKALRNPYIRSFSSFVNKFSLDHGLYSKESKFVLAVSTGLDSMCLLHHFQILKSLKLIKSFRVVHCNHQTRAKENKREQRFVEKYCSKNSLSLKVEVLEQVNEASNLEAALRLKRHKSLLDNLDTNELLVMAHHLDDSFEWSLMQKFRSSNIYSSLGIPAKNGKLIRPFMCVSKEQIKTYAKLVGLEFCEDSSNENPRFLRNDLRKNLIPIIKKNFPKYLKHYVFQQNEMAKLLDKHLLKRTKKNSCRRHELASGDIYLNFDQDSSESYQRKIICDNLRKLSNKKRGTWASQINKSIEMMKQNHSKGPLNLSGGVYLYSFGQGRCLLSSMKKEQSLASIKKYIIKHAQIPVVSK